MGAIPGRPVPLRRSRRELGACRCAVGRARAGKWFGGGYDEAGIHSVSPDPRDSRARASRSPAAASGRRATTARPGRWSAKVMSQAYMPPEQPATRTPRPAPRRAVPVRARHAVDAAPLRHLSLGRRRRTGRRSSRRATISASPWRCIRRTEDRVARAGVKDEMRMPATAVSSPHARRRPDAGETLRAGLAAAASLRPGLSPRPRRRRERHAPGDGLHHRRAVGHRRRRRAWQLVNAHLPPIYAVRFG